MKWTGGQSSGARSPPTRQLEIDEALFLSMSPGNFCSSSDNSLIVNFAPWIVLIANASRLLSRIRLVSRHIKWRGRENSRIKGGLIFGLTQTCLLPTKDHPFA